MRKKEDREKDGERASGYVQMIAIADFITVLSTK